MTSSRSQCFSVARHHSVTIYNMLHWKFLSQFGDALFCYDSCRLYVILSACFKEKALISHQGQKGGRAVKIMRFMLFPDSTLTEYFSTTSTNWSEWRWTDLLLQMSAFFHLEVLTVSVSIVARNGHQGSCSRHSNPQLNKTRLCGVKLRVWWSPGSSPFPRKWLKISLVQTKHTL